MSNALVELHCHILPGIDDGAKDLDMSMSLIRKELQDGAAGIVFTPHFHYERISVEQFTARRKAAFLQVSAACKAEGLRLAGKMGAEVFYSTALPSLDLRQLAFAGSNYILIEFPTTMHPPGIDETLYAIRAQGYTPILAHVERYPFVTEDPTLLYNWVCDDQRHRPDPGRTHRQVAAQADRVEPCAHSVQRLPPPGQAPAKPGRGLCPSARQGRPPHAAQRHRHLSW